MAVTPDTAAGPPELAAGPGTAIYAAEFLAVGPAEVAASPTTTEMEDGRQAAI
jgi:hypothetical protein